MISPKSTPLKPLILAKQNEKIVGKKKERTIKEQKNGENDIVSPMYNT
jgi:hypothetical protein